MAGFEWNTFYTLFKTKMKDISTVGRYKIPKSPTYPYTDISLSDNSGGNYDLQGVEGSQSPMFTITVYCDNYNDAKCQEVSLKAKELMIAYGFQCKTGPLPADNADPSVARWVARYQRVFGAGDELHRLN